MTAGTTGNGLQFCIRLRRVSPPVWRRIVVPEGLTIAEFRTVIQTAMGWEDQHLHTFDIRGERYGVAYVGGVQFRTRASNVRLRNFAFEERERVVYVYHFYSDWRHDIRVEKLGLEVSAPRCLDGRGACPLEDCGGAERFMATADERTAFGLIVELEELCDDAGLSDEAAGGAARDLIEDWMPWIELQFDRRAVNAALDAL